MEQEIKEVFQTLPINNGFIGFNPHNTWCMLNQFKPIAKKVFELANEADENGFELIIEFEEIGISFTIDYMRYTNGDGTCSIAKTKFGDRFQWNGAATIKESSLETMTGTEHSDGYLKDKLSDIAQKWRR